MSDEISHIPLDKISVAKNNIRTHDITVGIEDLATSIQAIGLVQPITVYLNSEKNYVILAGQRRFNAYILLNEKHPGKGYDTIPCHVISEPETSELKQSLSLAENITQLKMHDTDLVKVVTDLYNTYNDFDMVQKKFGLSRYMVNKYVRLARLPNRVKTAIREGEIHNNPKTAENAAISAVNSLQYTKDGDADIADVLELAKELAKSDVKSSLESEARKGGSVRDMVERAKKKPLTKCTINLSSEVAEKLRKVADSYGETENNVATSYVTKGVHSDYKQLDDSS